MKSTLNLTFPDTMAVCHDADIDNASIVSDTGCWCYTVNSERTCLFNVQRGGGNSAAISDLQYNRNHAPHLQLHPSGWLE